MYDRKGADEGHDSQYSKTSLRIWGMKEAWTWPFEGRDWRARKEMGGVAGSRERRRGMFDEEWNGMKYCGFVARRSENYRRRRRARRADAKRATSKKL